jgi:hypothetical protein
MARTKSTCWLGTACRRRSPEKMIRSLPGWFWYAARTRTRHGTYLRWYRHCLVTGISSATASCGGARRRPTGFCYGRSYGALKSSEDAQAHRDDDCVLDEASWGRACLQDQEFRWSPGKGSGPILPTPSSPSRLTPPGRSSRSGASPGPLIGARGALHRQRPAELRQGTVTWWRRWRGIREIERARLI